MSKTPKPYFKTETEVVTFRAKTFAKCLRKVATFVENCDDDEELACFALTPEYLFYPDEKGNTVSISIIA